VLHFIGGRAGFEAAAGQPIRNALLAQRDDDLRPREPISQRSVQLMGALEALNGMLLFGLTTAFLFAIAAQIKACPRSGMAK
jgi:hypothetical protein